MLSYAFQTLNQSVYEDIAVEEFEDMHNLFAAILAKGIGFQLKQGLYREYMNRQEDLPVMRGKMNIPGTVKNRLSRKLILTCEYDIFSENNRFNQILKTTVMLLLRHTKVKAEYKDDLKKKMLLRQKKVITGWLLSWMNRECAVYMKNLFWNIISGNIRNYRYMHPGFLGPWMME